MSTIVLRVTKGSQLTHSEVDSNFLNLNADKVEVAILALLAPLASPTFTGTVTIPITPVNETDAVSKGYVDAVNQTLDIKESVLLTSTANIDLAIGTLLTIDGIVTVAGDRILVKNQTLGEANGIYVAGVGAWARAIDADISAEVTRGMYIFVSAGDTQASMGFVLTTAGVITLGTSVLIFTQFSGAGQIYGGAGLIKIGNVLEVVGTANRITVNADDINIASTYVGQSSITTLGTITTGVC